MNHFDKVAKLLATENLTVVRAPVRTACFDTGSRTLTLPQWKGMTPEIETMLIGHEVGHALYTTEEMLAASEGVRALHGYINIIEDARIERLMKDRYPGLRKDFNAGYKQLNDKDFFGVQKRDVNRLRLIDRINLYFKVGYSCGVQFTGEELSFVRRAEKTLTPQDVIELSKEIFAYAKGQMEKDDEEAAQQEQQYASQDKDFDDEEDDFDYEYDNTGDYEEDGEMDQPPSMEDEDIEDFNDEPGNNKNAGYEGSNDPEQRLESETQRSFDKEMQELADTNTVYDYYTMNYDYVQDVVIPYKKILEETLDADQYHGSEFTDEFAKFMTDSQRMVNYLVKEFEMKKSAAQYKRAKISKVGSLDMKKIYSYKLKDDIFKRLMSLPEGKNHGMVFLLDWSGSMHQVLEDTIKQLIPLADFCRRVQIPFQVFAFSSEYRIYETYTQEYHITRKENDKNKVIGTNEHQLRLFEIMSNKMSNSDFIKMSKRLVRGMQYCEKYTLGGTPLNESLQYLIKYIPQFISKNNIEKMTLVTLSDGDGHAVVYPRTTDYIVENGEYKRTNIRSFVRDSVTKKDYVLKRDGGSQSQMLLQIMKDRYGINTVGFYICQNRRYDLRDAIMCNSNYDHMDASDMVVRMRKAFKDQGFFSLDGTSRDEMFIIPANKLVANDEDYDVSDKMTTKQIAKVFSKSMKGSRTSRILLDRFVARVA